MSKRKLYTDFDLEEEQSSKTIEQKGVITTKIDSYISLWKGFSRWDGWDDQPLPEPYHEGFQAAIDFMRDNVAYLERVQTTKVTLVCANLEDGYCQPDREGWEGEDKGYEDKDFVRCEYCGKPLCPDCCKGGPVCRACMDAWQEYGEI